MKNLIKLQIKLLNTNTENLCILWIMTETSWNSGNLMTASLLKWVGKRRS